MLHGKEISVWVKLFDAIYTVYGNVIMQQMQLCIHVLAQGHEVNILDTTVSGISQRQKAVR